MYLIYLKYKFCNFISYTKLNYNYHNKLYYQCNKEILL